MGVISHICSHTAPRQLEMPHASTSPVPSLGARFVFPCRRSWTACYFVFLTGSFKSVRKRKVQGSACGHPSGESCWSAPAGAPYQGLGTWAFLVLSPLALQPPVGAFITFVIVNHCETMGRAEFLLQSLKAVEV